MDPLQMDPLQMDLWSVVWNFVLFFHILRMSSSQLTHIFQRGRLPPSTRNLWELSMIPWVAVLVCDVHAVFTGMSIWWVLHTAWSTANPSKEWRIYLFGQVSKWNMKSIQIWIFDRVQSIQIRVPYFLKANHCCHDSHVGEEGRIPSVPNLWGVPNKGFRMVAWF